jgi:hypothetical protein
MVWAELLFPLPIGERVRVRGYRGEMKRFFNQS